MEKIITPEKLWQFTYTNERVCTQPIKGIMIFFHGAGSKNMYTGKDIGPAVTFGENGFLYLQPYCGPWAWSSGIARDYTEEILDVVFEKYNLPPDTPIALTGSSMGALSCFVFMAYKKKYNFISCVVNAPVTDMVQYYTSSPWVHHVLYSALYHDGDTIEEAIRTVSPLVLVDHLPTDINYYFYHGDADNAFPKHIHSEPLIKLLRERGCNIYYEILPGMKHAFPPPEKLDRFYRFSMDELKRATAVR